MAVGVEAELLDLIGVLLLGGVVGVVVARIGRFPYTIALLLAGLAASVLGIEFGIELSHDIILLVLLPPLLFEGAATTDLEEFRTNLPVILTLAVPGLILSVTVLGFLGSYAFGFPLLVAMLFAAMILPTDPVSVLALFDEVGAPERLSTLVEGESLINDGVGVVVFSSLLGLVTSGVDSNALFDPATLGDVVLEFLVSSAGGVLVGLAAGYAVYRVMVNLDEHMTEIVLTAILAYGSFLLAEHYLHVSGVIATVVAGLFIGNRGAEYAMSPQTKISIFNTWETAAFIVNTFIFVAIGVQTPVDRLLAHGRLILIAIVLVILARAVAVYPMSALANRFIHTEVSFDYQHVMVWGGLHASIPIALVLGLPQTVQGGAPFPFREELRAMVFGVAAFSLVVQGFSIGWLLDKLDVVTRSHAGELYELLVGRVRAVDAGLEAADELREKRQISPSVYEDFTEEYEREREDLNEAIQELHATHPEIRRKELLTGERQLLQREKSAVMDAVRTGTVSDEVGEQLLEEVNIKLDRVSSGESTVGGREEEAYEEFWRHRAAEFDVHSAELDETKQD
ncbi:Na+/H+ antiporter [Halopelagius longus]|uniref:Na+/H+ antiporter n=1 Tax=Halopelagius longus TaxID=1236180 RepID=A0A1H1C0Y4_9EURY|nr:Na+/H+ antiporter [Halopelagius longus]RDI71014.1 Na+/H+ antiporter [Halopelagius longus]SDQ57828.1 sodium/proton antiporter, CPA1 family [Halopelagius longus]